jgi:hypothetical protein
MLYKKHFKKFLIGNRQLAIPPFFSLRFWKRKFESNRFEMEQKALEIKGLTLKISHKTGCKIWRHFALQSLLTYIWSLKIEKARIFSLADTKTAGFSPSGNLLLLVYSVEAAGQTYSARYSILDLHTLQASQIGPKIFSAEKKIDNTMFWVFLQSKSMITLSVVTNIRTLKQRFSWQQDCLIFHYW